MPPEPSTDRPHEPGSASCPWCGSGRLRARPLAPRRRPALPGAGRGAGVRGVPGASGVDECRDCAHVFRRPGPAGPDRRPSPHGRFDPLPGHARVSRRHRAAARAMLHLPEPESWLDVGTGHAYFPQAARELFAYTAFDGLDATSRVIEARAAGRVEEAHVGTLTDPRITALLRRRYDVVSMFHHLEHTPDPRGELRAALTVLRPGGHLLLEVPHPHSAFGTLPGTWWPAEGRARHLHLIPPDNLRAELEAQGCTVLTTDHRAAHTPHDLTAAFSPLITRPLPKPLRRLTTPLVTAAEILDQAAAPLLRRARLSSAYRVIARKAEPRDSPI